ncbi:MAG: L,D-transpeptidase family protein [Bacteroidales bacterium]|nr:L,D-transpeptidase family protein [Bacteroidales bacterium]MDT8373254.1 L,D-transpeptidase family protein [Bacteroidales bacterium]
MKKRSLLGMFFYLAVAAAVIYLAVLLFRAMIPEAPQQEVERARAAIAAARDREAEVYSPRSFREARNSYDSAMTEWQRENERFILLRDYNLVISYASTAEKKAGEALRSTITRSGNLKTTLGIEISRMKKEMASFEKFFMSVPLPDNVKKKHARGKLLLREAEVDLQNERFVNGHIRITEAKEYITGAYNLARDKLEAYYSGYHDWQEWAASTVEESRRKKSYAIIVEKIPPLCHLYQGGKKKYTFEAEFGRNWMGDKMSSGDLATPEGKYMVTKKLSGRSTKYHKALMINYPNKLDIQEFNERIRTGQLPPHARIGDMIEIHGEGGKGVHWTEGCVALRNADMDLVFKYASNGTPVTIIGSSLTLEEFYETR